MVIKNLNNNIHKEAEAAVYVDLTVSQLRCFSDWGWVKFKTSGNGERIYFEKHLDNFATNILLPLEEVLNNNGIRF